MGTQGATHRDQVVGALADRQHGVVSREQLLAAGQTPRLIRRTAATIWGLLANPALPADVITLAAKGRKHARITPTPNHEIGGRRRDFAWPDHRLVVETDGYRYHSSREAKRRDNRRDRELTALGWRPLRFTYEEIAFRALGGGRGARRAARYYGSSGPLSTLKTASCGSRRTAKREPLGMSIGPMTVCPPCSPARAVATSTSSTAK